MIQAMDPDPGNDDPTDDLIIPVGGEPCGRGDDLELCNEDDNSGEIVTRKLVVTQKVAVSAVK